ncbi:alpha-mannosidase [Microcella humidisoli]|uniref:Glycosyl hydrolase-related protein n=1 Tax=Microcella humidisoli TaxID=2963406 RepID=A0ABY5FYG0_9MICO|nr:glycoside hydrolase family 38 C-terminal domain-containing protein [Microcella humidisoli]UTT63355.1 glycosyl hydrolase-related protein [Microcella humidisoli]
MHNDHSLVEARLDRFVRDHLTPALYRDARPLAATAWQVDREPVPFETAVEQTFEPVPLGWRWGRAWSTVWLRVTGEVPAEWLPQPPAGTRIEVLVDFGYNRSRSGFQAEGLAYRPDGSLIKSIAPLNSWLPVAPGERHIDVLIEAAANPDVAGEYTFDPTPYGLWETAPDEPLYELKQLEVALRDETVWHLLADVWTLRGLMAELSEGSSRRHEILRALEDMLDVLDPESIPTTAQAGRDAIAGVLAKPAHASAHRVLATGHAHIDSAWLWPLRETVRKCARTFTNVMDLMDEHPDFVFSCSSAQQYLWMKEHHPKVFARMKEKVAAGQFVPVGGMWVESDTNMPGGEAMARQFIAGKQFFIDEFGVECEEAWMPDSFGYSGALPQIVAAAGSRWFLTQKISWNQINRMPHHTFWWEGIDGTRVFTHFPPVDTYISELSGKELAHAERNFSEKGRASISLVPFGWGDGGGGPTREMIAAAHRTADLEGSPRVTMGSSRDFFEAAEAEYPQAPVWSGEMYLELHRGVFTSQLRTKQGNRRNESLLRQAELWAATAALRTDCDYPTEALARAWQTVLLLQFHDILPGSSIAWVHREAEQRHAAVTETLEGIIADALAALAGEGGEHDLLVNASPFAREGVPALGAATLAASHPAVTATEGADGATVLDNGIIRAVVDARGHVTSLIAHADGREAIPAGQPANVLRLHRDLPNLWDAWDLDQHYQRTVTELLDVDERHVRTVGDTATVITVRRVGESLIEQRLMLRAGESALEIENRIDWREREKILKLAVPLDVHADRIAAETQFGHLYRPTHTNTSWDAARFEACQHRFVHLGEPGYGVAIANDSTYGYDVGRDTRADGGTTTTVRFSLLRAPLFPDPESDQGEHLMRFRIAPGATIGDAVALGYDLATPLRAVRAAAPIAPIVTSSDPAVVVETVKLAEDGSGDLVVRLYESRGGRAHTTLTLDGTAEAITCTDLLERTLDGEPAGTGASIELPFRAFQLRTVRFRGVSAR